MKRILLYVLAIVSLTALVSCSFSAQKDTLAVTDQVITEEPIIKNSTSVEDLKALYESYINDSKFYEAYLEGKRITDIAPEREEGYLFAITALLEMSKSNYETINSLAEKAAVSMPDIGKLAELAEQVANNEPQLAISWPYIPDTTSQNELNTSGNTCGNMSAGGLVAVQGKWAYFSNQVDGGKLYKIKPLDTSERQKLCDDTVHFINVIGDTIYYCNTSDGDAIYSIRTDGSQRKKLNSDWCEFMSVENGWIYYGGLSNNEDGIYKMRMDGSEKTKLVSVIPKYSYVSGDWVYYVSKKDNGTLWRISINGGNPQRIVDTFVYFYTISGDRIYYLTETKPDTPSIICKIKMDGTEKSEIHSTDGNINTFNVFDKYLFIPAKSNNNKVMILDLTSQKTIRELNVYTEKLFCAEGLVLYPDKNDGDRIFRVNTNDWNVAKIDE